MRTDDREMDETEVQRYLWEYKPDNPRFGRAAFAKVRRGAGREPGSVPEMWKFQIHLEADQTDWRTNAEHHALVLYGFHQQSCRTKVHRKGALLGSAIWKLRDRFSADAVDARFFRAVTANDLNELALHLRGLVTQLRSLDPVPAIDYSALVEDLTQWQNPAQIDRIRRKWGSQYHRAGVGSEETRGDSKSEADAADSTVSA